MQVLRLFFLRIRSYAALNFLIGSLVGIYLEQAVLQASAQRGWLTVFALLAVGIMAYLFVPPVEAWVRKQMAGATPPMGDKPRRRAGLILLLSNAITANNAIEHHAAHNTLRTVQFIVTDHTRELFDELKPVLMTRGLSVRPEYMDDPYDPAEAAAAVGNCINWALRKGLNLSDLICDVTGGTSVMTVGAAAECQRAGRQIDVQVVTASYEQGRPLRPLHPVIVPIAAFERATATP